MDASTTATATPSPTTTFAPTTQTPTSTIAPTSTTTPTTTAAPTGPSVTITGNNQVAYCDSTFTLVAQTSSAVISYQWTVATGDANSDALVKSMWTGTQSPVLTLNNVTAISFNTTMNFTITVTNSQGTSSNTITVNRVNKAVPVLSTSASARTFFASQKILKLYGSTATCADEDVIISWKIQSGTLNGFVSGTTGYALSLYSSMFTSEGTYTFLATATTSKTAVSVSQVISIVYALDPLVASIDGGDRLVSRFANNIVLYGGASYDPSDSSNAGNYTWSCKRSNGLACADAVNTILVNNTNSKTVTIGVDMAAGTYVFTLVYAKGARSSSTFVTLSAGSSIPIGINLVLPTKVFANAAAVSMYAGITYNNSISVTCSWTCAGKTTTSSAMTLPITGLSLGFPSTSFTLATGITHTVQIQCQNPDGTISGTSQTTFSIETPPTAGRMFISPDRGDAITSAFTTVISGCTTNDNSPLLYYYAYLDPTSNKVIRVSRDSSLPSATLYLPAGSTKNSYNITVLGYCVTQTGNSVSMNRSVTVLPQLESTATDKEAQTLVDLIVTLILKYADPGQASNLVPTIIAVIKPIPASTSCISAATCSNRGTCSASVCTCNSGYYGSDCSVNSTMLAQRQEPRSQVLTQYLSILVGASTRRGRQGSVALTKQEVVQQLTALSSIVGTKYDLPSSTYTLLLARIQYLLSNSAVVDQSILDQVTQLVAIIMDSMALTNTVTYNRRAIYSDIIPLVASRTISALPATSSATIIGTSVGITVQSLPVSAFAASLQYVIGTTNLTMSKSISASSTALGLRFTSYKYNLYDTTVFASPVTSIALTTSSGSAVTATLNDPFSLAVPVTDASNILICNKWNADTEVWEQSGCTVTRSSTSSAVISSTSVGDFAITAVAQEVSTTAAPVVPVQPDPVPYGAIFGAVFGSLAGLVLVIVIVFIVIVCVVYIVKRKHTVNVQRDPEKV